MTDDIEDYETCAVHETAYLRASGCFACCMANEREQHTVPDCSTVPMAGGTPAASEAKDSPTLAAEMLRRLADSRWADGHRDTDQIHAAAEMLSRESRPSPGERAAAEVKAELAEITGARVAIRQARYTASRFKAGNPATVERHALHLLGYNGDTEAELFEDVKRTADLGNVVSRELLRQDEAAKRAKTGERR